MKDAVFDLGGLLVDTGRMCRDGWLWGFQQFDIHIPKEVVNAQGRKDQKQSLDILVQAAGSPEKVQKVRVKYEEYLHQQLTSGTIQLEPYTKEILADSRERHMKLGIATTTVTEKITDILDHFQLTDYLDTFTLGDEVSEDKPPSVPYLTALEQTGLEALSTFIVEGSLVGVTIASCAGLGAALIPDSSFVRNCSIEEKGKLSLLAEGKDLRTVIEMLGKKTER